MDRTRRLAVSLTLNIGLVVAQIAFGLVAHSTGLLADAGHNLTDVGALTLSLVAVRLPCVRPAPPAPTATTGPPSWPRWPTPS